MNFISTFINQYRHNYINKKLNKYFLQANKYSLNGNLYINNKNENIWFFWWQGKKAMPNIVSKCWESINKHSNGHNIVFIDKDNFYKYTDISQLILNKFYNGKISITHFSDILRFNLLKNHGGLWIDSTVYFNENVDYKYFSYFYTSGVKDNFCNNFINVNYTGFLIGGKTNNPIFSFMNEFFYYYWIDNNKLIEYFIIDYALNYCYEQNIGGMKDYIESNYLKNNPNIHQLLNYFNYNYNKKIYNHITKNTIAFKLTYKGNFNIENDTFYNRFINNIYPFNK